MGSKPVMMPETPATVSPTAGWQACVTSWICWIVTESTHVAFGYCVAEATPATQSSAATARKRVNILLMSDPLVAGGQERMWDAIRGSWRVCWRAPPPDASPSGARVAANDDMTWGTLPGLNRRHDTNET